MRTATHYALRTLLCAGAVISLMIFAAHRASAEDGWNRTGFYAGAVGGYDLAEMKAESFKLSDGQLFAGAFGGFNSRVGPNLVIGIEGDWMYLNVKASQSAESVSITASSRYLASIRGRVGVPIGPALAFLTAGVAFTDHKIGVTVVEEGSASDKKMLTGAAFGGGLEVELTKSVFVGVQVIHYWFPDEKMSFGEGDTFKSGQHQTIPSVRIGVKF